MKTTIRVSALILFAAVLVGYLHGRNVSVGIEIAPDSSGYHFPAIHLLRGQGYVGEPIGPPSMYDAHTLRLFPGLTYPNEAPSGRQGVGRTPGYPLFLAGVYALHGVNPDVVLRYQVVLAGLTGGLLVLAGWLLWGTSGLMAGVAAAFLWGVSREAAYPAGQLLTECLAAFLLTAAFAAASWARRGGWARYPLVGVLLSAAILTRPGLIFVALTYGACLLLGSLPLAQRREAGADSKEIPEGMKRPHCRLLRSLAAPLAFALPCAMLLGTWSVLASARSGRLTFLGDNGSSILIAGLDPQGAARAIGVVAPAIEVAALQDFWRSYPGSDKHPRSVPQELRRIPGRWREVLQITVIKLRATIAGLPNPAWLAMVLGAAVVASARRTTGVGDLSRSPKLCRDQSVSDAPSHATPSRGATGSAAVPGARVTLASLALWFLAALGFSHTLVQAWFLAVLVLLPLLSALSRLKSKTAETQEPWIISWMLGFLIMTVCFFGHPRFIRPFLPVFYLCATMGLPLLAAVVCAGRAGTVPNR